MSDVLRISLERLRQYGWTLWDPIGLVDTECPRDEYDTYLVGLVSALRAGDSDIQAVDYLIAAETEWIGLTERSSTRDRAWALVAAVKEYLRDFPDGPLEVR